MAAGSETKINDLDEDYFAMEEIDEENINWGKLLARAFSILLLVIIICCAAVGAIYEKFYFLAALAAVVLVCVFGLSFLDVEAFKTRTVEVFRLTRASATGSSSVTSGNTDSLL